MLDEKYVYLINNDECDVIEYEKCEDISSISLSDELNSIMERISFVLRKSIKKAKIYKVKEFDSEKIEIFSQYMIGFHLIELSKKYSIKKLDKLFSKNQTKEQINLIFQLLENEVLVINEDSYSVIDEKCNNNIYYEIALYLCQEVNNEKIDNIKYDSIYKMKKEALRLLLKNERFTQFRMVSPTESNSIIVLFLKKELYNKNTTYADIYEKIKLTEYCVKNFPKDIVSMLDYFLVNGKQMLPIYKEIYQFIDYYSEAVVGLDYTVILKVVKKCKKMGITSEKDIRKKLGFTNIKSLNKVLNKNN